MVETPFAGPEPKRALLASVAEVAFFENIFPPGAEVKPFQSGVFCSRSENGIVIWVIVLSMSVRKIRFKVFLIQR